MVAIDRLGRLTQSNAIKNPCRVATTGNITLDGEQTIDGVSAVSGDRVLVWQQSDTTQNGIYVCDTGLWTRDVDFDGPGDVAQGTIVGVTQGHMNVIRRICKRRGDGHTRHASAERSTTGGKFRAHIAERPAEILARDRAHAGKW